ncbi:AEC family transporter [Variovorax sp. ZT4R33]|uniref:AEC family transporter n=1 Tax=Variovorax sp. ZT4R33 TaxID=3443743 RepID=UPI003F44701E
MLKAVNYAQLLFPDFSLIACGWLLCRYTALDRRVWDQVESLVYYFLFPVLLFHSIVRSPIDFGATSNLLAAGLGVSVIGVVLSYALPHLPWLGRHIDRREHAGGAQIAFRFNSFICLAMADRLAGPQGLLLIAVLIGVCVPLMNVAAVWPMARHAQTGFVRQLLRNPLIIATASGLVVNLLGITVPSWMEPTLNRIGAASLALGLMAAGAGMQFATLAQGKVLATSLLAIRHLILPLVGWVLSRALGLDPVQSAVLMAFAAVPTASSAYVLAARMGYNGPYVAGLVTLSTILGVLSLPFALALPR